MAVKYGYKQTELGVIPQDWEVAPLGDIMNFQNGVNAVRSAYGKGIKFANVLEVITNPYLQEDDIPGRISVSANAIHSYSVRNGDVLFNRTSETQKEIGLASVYVGSEPVVFGGFVIRGRLTTDRLLPVFAGYGLRGKCVRDQLVALGQGAVRANIGQSDLKTVAIPLPPQREQQAVAEALSDADALIDSLEQLLAKKRQIKQGAMQELLTGKKRLPGFSTEWNRIAFGEIVRPRKQRVDPRRSGPHEFCIELENIEQGTGCLSGFVTTGEESSLKSVFQKGDVLFGKLRAYLRKYWLADRDGVCSTEIWVLTASRPQLIPPFLFQIVRMNRFIEAASEAYGTHMPRSDWNVVKTYEVLLPSIAEQTAISSVLADMDEEIAVLETKLAKARQIKQGMMQELLTGRIRLVRPSAEVIPFKVETKAIPASKTAHNAQINEAVIIAAVVHRYATEQFPMGRFRRTKLSYLLHRYIEHKAEGFQKKAAGPYNPNTRYGGAEKIALRNGYVRAHKNGNAEGFVAGAKIAQAEDYFEKWYGSHALNWLDQFRYKTNDELELLTTVDMASEEIQRAGEPINVSGIKQVILSAPEWKAKLNRPIFSDEKIVAAIQMCNQLFQAESDGL